jgi:hypothetical protein
MNPFSHIDVGYSASVALSDFDKDGDLDLVVGNSNGGSLWYDNVGNATNPEFRIRRSKDNPLTTSVASYSTFAAGDVDGDGDDDIYVVGGNGFAFYFENNSTGRPDEMSDNYLFFERNLGSSSVLSIPQFNNGIPRKFRASVDQADLDGDGDADLILSWADGEVGTFRNVGKREDKKVSAQMVHSTTVQYTNLPSSSP